MACMYALLEHRRVVAPHQPVPRFDVDLSRKNYPPVALLLCKYPLPFFYLLLFFSPVLPRLPYFFFFFFFFFCTFQTLPNVIVVRSFLRQRFALSNKFIRAIARISQTRGGPDEKRARRVSGEGEKGRIIKL